MSKDDEIIDEYYTEDTWKCSSCQKVNEGHELRCKGCDSPKEENEQYVTRDPATAQRVTDPVKLKEAKAGPNRTCPFCKADCRLIMGKCSECGAAVEEMAPPPRNNLPSPWARPTAPPKLKPMLFKQTVSWLKNWWLACVCVSGTLLGILGIMWLFSSHQVQASVSNTHWKVVRSLEQRETVHDEGWGSPPGAFNESCSTKIRDYVQCNPRDCNPYQKDYECHPHKCNCSTYNTTSSGKNGYSKVTVHRTCDTCYDTCTRTAYHTCYDQCPEYGSWCSYDYYHWVHMLDDTREGSGGEVEEPTMTADTFQRISQHEKYEVAFTDGTKTWSYTPSNLSDYRRFCFNPKWEIEVNHFGSVKPLQPR